MLTRLKVSGFKNLVDVDVRFGAFTCIAGANGVGKSNLFDAIRFLSASAQMPLKEAALSIRDSSGKQSDIRNLFHRVGDHYVDKMSFEAEMIIPKQGTNDLGQIVNPSTVFIKYFLELAYKKDDTLGNMYKLEILKEELSEIQEYKDNLLETNQKISHKIKTSDLEYREYQSIFTNIKIENTTKLHVKLQIGRDTEQFSLPFIMKNSSKTFLLIIDNGFNYSFSATLFLTKKEMMSWQLLQLEPSPLRKSNEFTAPNKLGMDGSNLAASFYHLVEKYCQQDVVNSKHNYEEIEAKVYAQASNRLAELINDVDRVWIERDDQRELLTLMLTNKQGTVFPARSLSDGTLRLLALIALELDPDSFRLLCLEEPENGIYPDRLTKILQLLIDMTVDLTEPIGFDNPLRQVIINTHSSAVVQQVPEDSLLIASLEETIVDGKRSKQARFRYLANTWRDVNPDENRRSKVISKGKLLSYLNPVPRQLKNNRVIDRPDLQSLLPGN